MTLPHLLNKANFYLHSQELLNKHYLQPLKKTSNGSQVLDKPVSTVKNGVIERQIHGAMHATRVSIYIEILDQIMKNEFRSYADESIHNLETDLQLSEASILLLTRYVALCHDAAREGEGADYWEVESADIAKRFLKENGLDERLAAAFSLLAQYKDDAQKLEDALGQLGFSDKTKAGFNYLRRLVSMADCFDIIRCNGRFKFSYIEEQLKSIPGFESQKHSARFFEFAKQVYALLKAQHDLFFPTHLVNSNNEIYSLPKADNDFSLVEKEKFEHAKNVFETMVTDMRAYPYFNNYLHDELNKETTNTAPVDEKKEFNPFIHGTTSATLALLPKTNFQLIPILKMMDDHQAAPMVGELTQGGYSVLGSELVQEEIIGGTSFGNLKTGTYNLKKITASYTQFEPPASDATLKHFKDMLKYSLNSGFSNLNLLLIYFTRARQMHQSLDQVITTDELDLLNQQLQATIQFYYFIQLLGTHIHPDFEAVKKALTQSKSLKKRDITDAAYSLLNIEQIVQKIMLHKIDMKDVVLHPTEENLNKVLQVLEFPKKATIKSGFGSIDKEIELPVTQFFSLKKSSMEEEGDEESFKKSYDKGQFGYFSRNINGYGINDYLEQMLSNKLDSKFFAGLGKKAEKHAIIMEDRIHLFDKLVKTPQEQFKITEEQQSLLKSTFPIIFVSESEHIKPYSSELRSKVPLKLGDDIRIIATNTKNNRDKLKSYFYAHQLDPIQVVLFSDLESVSYRYDKSTLPLSIDSQQLRNLLTETKNSKHGELFYQFYKMMDNLNDKRNKFRNNNPQAFAAMHFLLSEINKEMDRAFSIGKPITGSAIRAFCTKSNELIKQQKTIFEQHRGILGTLDTVLTILASLVILYPVVYLYQKTNNIQHTFFNTDTSMKVQDTMATLSQMNASSNDFPEGLSTF